MKTSITSILTVGTILFLGLHAAPVRADILYVANRTTSTVERFTSGGVGSVYLGVGSGLNLPVGLAFDSAANLYVASGDNRVLKFTPAPAGSVFLAAGSNVNNPHGLAFDAAGNLYDANAGDNRILKFTPTPAGSVFANTGLSNPGGLAFDRSGNLFAANLDDNTIRKFSPAGTDLGVFASTGLNQPFGLAFDSAGNLYAANQGDGGPGSNTIEKFTPGGIGSVFASSGLSTPEFLAFTDEAGAPLPLANQVPEPSTWAMLAAGAGSLLAFRRGSRSRSSQMTAQLFHRSRFRLADKKNPIL